MGKVVRPPQSKLGKPVKDWSERVSAHTVLLKRFGGIAATAAVLAGCTTTGGDYCSIAAPINPTADDVPVISAQLVDGVLEHNETYARICRK